jgi:hypothetical protein
LRDQHLGDTCRNLKAFRDLIPHHAHLDRTAPVELPLSRREHARDVAVLVHQANFPIVQLNDLKVRRHRSSRRRQQEVDARVLELRHRQVIDLHIGPSQRIENPAHARLENGHEAPVPEQQATLVLGDGDSLHA